jgi:hypothetical protein
MLFALLLAYVRSETSIAVPCGMGVVVAATSHGQYHEGGRQYKAHTQNDLTVVSKDGLMVAASHEPGVYVRKQRCSGGCLAPFCHQRLLNGHEAFLLPM